MRRIFVLLMLLVAAPIWAGTNAFEVLPTQPGGAPLSKESFKVDVKDQDVDTTPDLMIHGRSFTQINGKALIKASSTSAADHCRLRVVGVGKDSTRTVVTARINGTATVSADTLLFVEYAFIDSGTTLMPQGKIIIKTTTPAKGIMTIAPGQLWSGAAHRFICKDEQPLGVASFLIGHTQTSLAQVQATLQYFPNWKAATVTTLAGARTIASSVEFAPLTLLSASTGQSRPDLAEEPYMLSWPTVGQRGYVAVFIRAAAANHTVTSTLGLFNTRTR